MTTNKNLQQPANGSDVGYWDQPLNNNFTLIDAALGAVQQFNVGSVGPVTINVSGGTFVGAYPANTPSYVPLVMYVFGAPTGNITLQLPAGVGGQWIIWNAISNSYTLTVKMSGGTASVVIPNSSTRSVYCDQATGIYFSDSQTTVAGSSGQVIYNSGGSLTSSANLAFDGTTLTAANLASSTNIAAAGNIAASGTVTGNSVTSTTSVTVGTGINFPDGSTQVTANGGAIPSAFSGLQINASVSTISVNYNYVSLMSGTSFRTVSAGSLSISATTSGANGLDTGTIAANTWYAVYVIYNPTTMTSAGLISLSGTAPTLPSGYTYMARVGWVRYGASALVPSIQYGNRAMWVSQSSGYPVISNTSQSQWTAFNMTALGFAPSTAGSFIVSGFNPNSSGAAQYAVNSNSNVSTFYYAALSFYVNGAYLADPTMQATIQNENGNIYIYANSPCYIFSQGWLDNL